MDAALTRSKPDLRSGPIRTADYDDYHAKGAFRVRGVIEQSTVEELRTAAAGAMETKLQLDEAAGVARPAAPHFRILRNVYEQDRSLARSHGFEHCCSGAQRDTRWWGRRLRPFSVE
jgi:hypothetical protein